MTAETIIACAIGGPLILPCLYALLMIACESTEITEDDPEM